MARIHGTRYGYDKHQATGSDPCGPCRAAKNAYNREYWRTHPEYRRRKAASKARWRERRRCVRGLGWPLAPEGWWAE